MSEIRKCPKCGNLQSRLGRFCAQCGTDLSHVPETPYIVTTHEPRSYAALRIASSFMILFGWLIIIVSIGISLYLFGEYAMNGAVLVIGQSPQAASSSTFPFLLSVFVGLFGATTGIFQIAAGQVFMLLLDIRDDVHGMIPK